MKFAIEQKELSALTNIASRAASNRNTIPVLSGLLINASFENGLTFTATDMEIGITASNQKIQVFEEGTVLVNAHYFSNIIKVLPDTVLNIELNTNQSKLNLNYLRSSISVNTYFDYEYPSLPLDKLEEKFEIEQIVLRDALRKTVFSASLNHFRQVFTGVLVDLIENNELRFVASDTHRLAFFKLTLPGEKIEPFRFILPTRTINELLRLLDNSDEKIKIGLSQNNVVFYKSNFLLISRLISGQYPTYEQVIPASHSTELSIKTVTLNETLDRARVMPTDDKLKIPSFKLSINENELMISTHSVAMGEINDLIEEVSIDGNKDFTIAFNTNYFSDIVKLLAMECENITIKMSGPLGPSVISNPNKENYIYVLVPLRTNS